MKKKFILVALLIAAGAVTVYRLVNQAPSESLAANERMLAILTDGGCMECHSATPKLPFYANFPVAGKLVKEDIEKGYREFDVEPMMTALKNGEKVSEVDLAKVEKVIKDGTMPLAKYYLIHWGSSMTAKKIVSLVFTIGFLFVVLPEGIKVFSPNPDIQEHNISLKKSTPQIRSYCDYPPPLTHKRSEMHPAPLIRPPFLLIHIIVAILLVGFNLTIRLFLKSLHDEEILKELEHQHLESELQYLKYQLNPHFFMNTLNNIHALVDIDGEKAKQTILELSKLMRYVLYEANKSRISLEREIQFLENYIALMRLRYTEQLTIKTNFPVIVPDIQIPPLLFITLLENAFKHGVSYQESSYIEVSITRTDEGIAFACHNSKHTCTAHEHHGIGIENIKKRLHLLYGNNYTFTLTEDASSYHVLLIIPPLS